MKRMGTNSIPSGTPTNTSHCTSFRVTHFQSLMQAYTTFNVSFTKRSPYNVIHSTWHHTNGCFQFGAHIPYSRETEY